MGFAWTVASAFGVRIGLRNSQAIVRVVEGIGIGLRGWIERLDLYRFEIWFEEILTSVWRVRLEGPFGEEGWYRL